MATPLHCDALQVVEIVRKPRADTLLPAAACIRAGSASALCQHSLPVLLSASALCYQHQHQRQSEQTRMPRGSLVGAAALMLALRPRMNATVFPWPVCLTCRYCCCCCLWSLQVGCWLVALFGVCKTAVTIERARHGGDSNMFERLLRGRLRRRVMCSGGVSVICAVILHSVLPYYVEYHVVNVFDQRGHESRFVMGISMVFWLTCLGACARSTTNGAAFVVLRAD